MQIYKLSKAVLSFKNNAEQFLNGLTSNTLAAPRNAFLDIHGRIIVTFDQIRMNEEEVLVVIENRFTDSLLAHLDKYIRLQGVKVQRLNCGVFFDLSGDYALSFDEFSIAQNKGKIVITKSEVAGNVLEQEFTLFRLKNNIPWLGIDYQPDDMLLNISETEFVSYTKGCYLGQEFISKVHSRSKPTWKLVVRPEDECNPQEKEKMTSKTYDPETQKTLGFLFVRNT